MAAVRLGLTTAEASNVHKVKQSYLEASPPKPNFIMVEMLQDMALTHHGAAVVTAASQATLELSVRGLGLGCLCFYGCNKKDPQWWLQATQDVDCPVVLVDDDAQCLAAAGRAGVVGLLVGGLA